jgi:hypothetical protein
MAACCPVPSGCCKLNSAVASGVSWCSGRVFPRMKQLGSPSPSSMSSFQKFSSRTSCLKRRGEMLWPIYCTRGSTGPIVAKSAQLAIFSRFIIIIIVRVI